MNDLISVIVPIYNVELYLHCCIQSIINQTYKNLEIILVDDGSTDGCGNICDFYSRKDQRIKVIHKINGGLSAARNSGLKVATGKYVCFIDSDDFISALYIESLYFSLKKTNTDIAICDFKKFTYSVVVDEKYSGKIEIVDYKQALINLYDNKKYIQYVVAWNKLYRKTLFDTVSYPEGKLHEDEYTTYLLFNKNTKICYVDDILYFYRIRPNSIMVTQGTKNIEFKIESLEERCHNSYFVNDKTLYALNLYKLIFYYEKIFKYNNDFKEKLQSLLLELKGYYKYLPIKKRIGFMKKKFLYLIIQRLYR